MLFVEHLTKLLTDNLPDLWKLGQTYLSGKLYKEVSLPSLIAQFDTTLTFLQLIPQLNIDHT